MIRPPPSPPLFPYTPLFRSRVTEVVLARSSASGAPARLCLDRRYLRRAVQLGFAELQVERPEDRKSTRLNSSHMSISYAVFCLKKKKKKQKRAASLRSLHRD